MKILLLALLVGHLSLNAADDQSVVAKFTGEEKQKLLLDYMFNQGFVADIARHLSPLSFSDQLQLMKSVNSSYQPDKQAYKDAHMACKNMYCAIQGASPENKQEMVESCARFHAELILKHKAVIIQEDKKQKFELFLRKSCDDLAAAGAHEQFMPGIRDLFSAFHLQQALEIPRIEEQDFDTLHQRKTEKVLRRFQGAVISQQSVSFELPVVVEELLSQTSFDEDEIRCYADVCMKTTREILTGGLSEPEVDPEIDPYVGGLSLRSKD